MANLTGRIAQIQGGVIDCEFPAGRLPEIYEALEVRREGNEPLVLEVENYMGDYWVRCLAMDTTDGLQRGCR